MQQTTTKITTADAGAGAGAGAGAHQKMTAPNCLIRALFALFLLQCCSAARLSRWPA
jgi:hypothetical protein